MWPSPRWALIGPRAGSDVVLRRPIALPRAPLPVWSVSGADRRGESSCGVGGSRRGGAGLGGLA